MPEIDLVKESVAGGTAFLLGATAGRFVATVTNGEPPSPDALSLGTGLTGAVITAGQALGFLPGPETRRESLIYSAANGARNGAFALMGWALSARFIPDGNATVQSRTSRPVSQPQYRMVRGPSGQLVPRIQPVQGQRPAYRAQPLRALPAPRAGK